MTELVITRGLPASGKTTWAKEWVAECPGRVRLNRDDTRAMFSGVQGKGVLPYDREQVITKMHHDAARAFLRAGVSVVVDDTNLRAKFAKDWKRLASTVGADFVVQDFTDVPLDVCLARNDERSDRVPDDVIRSMHAKFIAGGVSDLTIEDQPAARLEPYLDPGPGSPDVYLVDIDGTVAIKGDRDIYDGSKVHLDTVNEPVVRVIGALESLGAEIIYVSGRSDEFREQTESWLRVNGLSPDSGLFMRAAGDKRRDSVVKYELFTRHVRGKYRVCGVFDDRNQVVEMWREIGLTVFQVAEGNF